MQQLDSPLTAGNRQRLGGQHRAGRFSMGGGHTALHDFDFLPACRHKPGTGPGVHAPHPVVDVCGRLRQFELGHGLVQHGGQGGVFVVLLLGLERPCRNGRDGLTEDAGPHSRHTVKQLAAGLLGVNGHLLTDQHIAGVEALIHLHDGDTRLSVPIEDCPLHRGAATVLGQQGDMQVDAAVFRDVQHAGGQDAAIGHHHDELRGQRLNVGVLASVPQGAGREDGRAMLQSNLFDRRSREHLLATHRLIPACVDGADIMPCSVQSLEALGSNVRRTHEQNAHQLFPFALRAAARPSSVSS